MDKMPIVTLIQYAGLEYVSVSMKADRISKEYGPVISAQHLLAADVQVAKAIIERSYVIRGKELEFIRKALGLSARELAEAIHVEHPTIRAWEKDPEKRLEFRTEIVLRLFFGDKLGVKLDPRIELLAPISKDEELSVSA